MQYRKEIDGLRAIAVISVILYHAGVPFFNGGFIGVDIFFVISGFLITSIISSEIEQGKFSIINFYERRARRIMPMLFFILLITSVYAWFCLLPSDMKSYSSSVISVVFFYSNIHFYIEAGYWDVASELKPLLHTWSLAVEEQYYLLFPLFLLFTKKIKSSTLIIIVVIITAASLGFSQWSSNHAPTSDFYLLPTRFWELAIGALIGLASIKYPTIYNKVVSNKIINNIMSFIGLLMILVSILFFTESTPFPGFIALLPTIGAALIIVFASGNTTITGKILSTSLMVQIGLISYSAYLWHQPMLAFARYQAFPELSGLTKTILVLLVFPLSYLSWKFIELPFKNKVTFSKKKIFTFWALSSITFLIIGFSGIISNGFDKRNVVSAQKILNYQPDNKILEQGSLKPLKDFAKKYHLGYQTVGSEIDNNLWYDTLNTKPKLLVIGNSHGENLYNTFNHSDSVKSKFQLAFYGYQVRFFNDPANKLFASPNYKASNVVVIGSRLNIDDMLTLDKLISRLYADGKVVVLVKNVFLFDRFGSRTLADFIIQKKISENPTMDPKTVSSLVNVVNREYYDEFKSGRENYFDRTQSKVFGKLASKFKNLIILDRMDYMCDYNKKLCFVVNDQLEKFIFDDGHNSNAGYIAYGHRIDQSGWMKLNLINNEMKTQHTLPVKK